MLKKSTSKSTKIILGAILGVVMGIVLSQCSKTDNRILGTIENQPIHVTEFLNNSFSKKELKQYQSQLNDQSINYLFQQHAMLVAFAKEADKENFFHNPKMQKQLNEQLEAIDESLYPRYLGTQLIDKKMNSVKVDNAALAPYQKRVQVRHILLKKEGLGKDPEQVKKITTIVLNDLKNKTHTFGELAKKYSEDPGSAANEGLIEEWIYENSPFVESFKKAALNGKEKEIIPNVVSEYGTHIIYIEKAQKRSISDIKKEDPSIISSIEESKKEAILNDFNKNLLNEFKDRIQTYHQDNLFELLQKHEKNQDVVIAEIKDFKKITVGYFYNMLFRDSEKNFQSFVTSTTKAKANPNEQLSKALNQNVIMINLYILKAKELGADKALQGKKNFQITHAKGSVYANSIIEKIPKLKTPQFNVSDAEIHQFYEANKNTYFQEKDPKTNKTKTAPFNAETKKRIKEFLINQKKQDFEQKQQMTQYNALDAKAKSLYPQYNITITPLVEKRKMTTPAENQKPTSSNNSSK